MKYVWIVKDGVNDDVTVFRSLGDAEKFASTMLSQARDIGFVTEPDGITFSQQAIKKYNMMSVQLYKPSLQREISIMKAEVI